MSRTILNQVKKLKMAVKSDISDELYQAIKQGKRYCDLSEDLKEEYCLYRWDGNREGFEGVERILLAHNNEGERILEPGEARDEPITSRLEFKPRPLTDKEFQERESLLIPISEGIINGTMSQEEIDKRYAEIDERFGY